ncbi:SAM-dependent methyltransferase [Pseudofrankia asymbiotica]|uniref:SAM-dependent methyltransferase n=1 Tax=Pseudofrankia asymbiotica TaxID=1834516 RepID=A0A1V2IAN0_9ACTN|nr:SAM-dependent methyltransferase [Pseudofrankia asymbiotica]ONH28660.1 SAM-dependent methyltransferase [Pseudofrankia asymbiotica]
MTVPGSYFDRLYAASDDPWGFRDRWYERRKRALTMALLPDARYGTAYEPGCSIGLLTAELAGRCDRLLATDIAPAAVEAARHRTRDLPHVDVQVAALPADWPPGGHDLVVLSEVGYYLDRPAAADLAHRAAGTAGTLLAVHWRPDVGDYPLGGDDVHDLLATATRTAGLTHLAHHRDDDLVADVWCTDPRSVATRTGLR